MKPEKGTGFPGKAAVSSQERSAVEMWLSLFALTLLLLALQERRLDTGALSASTPVPSAATNASFYKVASRVAGVGEFQHWPAPALLTLPALSRVYGQERRHTVRRGETLLQIARRSGSDASTLARINGLAQRSARPGQTLILPTRYIVPAEVRDGLVLNIPERGVYVFQHGQLVARYPVAVGQRGWETPTGAFRVARRVLRPIWIPPREMVRRKGISAQRVPPGPRNPLGNFWIGWTAPEVGFHATHLAASIGQPASHACVRLYPEHARRLFQVAHLKMPIYAVYAPIKVGQDGDAFVVSVSPDIYGRRLVSEAKVRQLLERAGLRKPVDAAKLRRILARQDGYPHVIAVQN